MASAQAEEGWKAQQRISVRAGHSEAFGGREVRHHLSVRELPPAAVVVARGPTAPCQQYVRTSWPGRPRSRVAFKQKQKGGPSEGSQGVVLIVEKASTGRHVVLMTDSLRVSKHYCPEMFGNIPPDTFFSLREA